MAEDNRTLTGAFGAPADDDQNTLTAGWPGPALLQDVHLIEKLAHFDRERIPERGVQPKGAGGYFEVTHDVTGYTRATFLSAVGKRTDVFARFSTVGGETGSADSEHGRRVAEQLGLDVREVGRLAAMPDDERARATAK